MCAIFSPSFTFLSFFIAPVALPLLFISTAFSFVSLFFLSISLGQYLHHPFFAFSFCHSFFSSIFSLFLSFFLLLLPIQLPRSPLDFDFSRAVEAALAKSLVESDTQRRRRQEERRRRQDAELERDAAAELVEQGASIPPVFRCLLHY